MDEVDRLDIDGLKELERRNRDAGALESTGGYVSDESQAEVVREDRLIHRLLSPKPSWTVLDAGCGTGRYSLSLAREVARVVAVDFSSASVARLLQMAEDRGITNIDGIAADLCDSELPAASMDGAISVEVLQHIPGSEERAKAVRSIAAALRPGAPFVMTAIAWNRRAERPRDGFWGNDERRIWRHHFDRSELIELLSKNGFEQVRSQHFHALPRRVLRRMPSWTLGLASTFDVMARPLEIGTHLVAWARRA